MHYNFTQYIASDRFDLIYISARKCTLMDTSESNQRGEHLKKRTAWFYLARCAVVLMCLGSLVPLGMLLTRKSDSTEKPPQAAYPEEDVNAQAPDNSVPEVSYLRDAWVKKAFTHIFRKLQTSPQKVWDEFEPLRKIKVPLHTDQERLSVLLDQLMCCAKNKDACLKNRNEAALLVRSIFAKIPGLPNQQSVHYMVFCKVMWGHFVSREALDTEFWSDLDNISEECEDRPPKSEKLSTRCKAALLLTLCAAPGFLVLKWGFLTLLPLLQGSAPAPLLLE
ncbi:uncharacterized protein NEMAJ01_2010 [Nematocida major]|uniref:uncharacterized protein n=1 Tax=Nematocida major TaxID=1912982 RepID=UPI00200724DC|nr:uncharacterized protein NEMAJ01_2010 [Nematocida major]KAH9387114.1 hypothetical protein NEMAJ01_2010 [Nematocida major]